MANEIKVKTVGSDGRHLAIAKGDVICVCIAILSFVDEYWVTYKSGAVIIKTTASRFARRVYPGEELGEGILLHHTSGVRVWIPINKAERPVLQLFDKNGPVKYLPDTYAIARRRLLAATGRAALWALLAVLALLAGCAGTRALPYEVPDAVDVSGMTGAWDDEGFRLAFLDLAEKRSPSLEVLRQSHRLALAGDARALERLRQGLSGRVNVLGLDMPLGVVVAAIESLVEWLSGKSDIEEDLLRAQYAEARHALRTRLSAAFDEHQETQARIQVLEGRLADANADLEAVETLIERGLLTNEPAKEVALARERVHRAEDELAEIKARKNALFRKIMNLAGRTP